MDLEKEIDLLGVQPRYLGNRRDLLHTTESQQISVSDHPPPPFDSAALVHKHSLDFFFKFETCKSGLHMGDSADTFAYQRLSQKPVILKVCPQPAISALPRNFEMSHPTPNESENLGMESNNLFFFSPTPASDSDAHSSMRAADQSQSH